MSTCICFHCFRMPHAPTVLQLECEHNCIMQGYQVLVRRVSLQSRAHYLYIAARSGTPTYPSLGITATTRRYSSKSPSSTCMQTYCFIIHARVHTLQWHGKNVVAATHRRVQVSRLIDGRLIRVSILVIVCVERSSPTTSTLAMGSRSNSAHLFVCALLYLLKNLTLQKLIIELPALFGFDWLLVRPSGCWNSGCKRLLLIYY